LRFKMLKFSIKNAFRKKSTAILSSIGVGVGVMLVFVIGAFTAGVSAQFADNLTRTIGIVEVIEKDQTGYNSHLPLTMPDELYNTPGVGEFIINYNIEVQAPNYFLSNYSSTLSTPGDSITLYGLNKSLDQNWEGVTTKLLSGRLFNIGANEAIIDSRLIDQQGFSLGLNDQIFVRLDPGGFNISALTIVGIYKQDDNGAPSFVPRQYYLYTDVATTWNLLKDAGENSNIYTSIELRFNADTSQKTQEFVKKINDYSQEGGYAPTFVAAFALSAFFESIESTFAIFDAFAAIIGLITVLAGGMAIIVTQLMSVMTRMKEFAILKSTGWKNRHIFENVIFESLTLGILGAIIGISLGWILIFFLSGDNSLFGSASAIVTPQGIIEVLAYAIGLGVLGGLYPGIKAARVRPVVVLKGE
jgi:putative ABC transport system permease protein